MKLLKLKEGKHLTNFVTIDPGAVAAPVLDKNAFVSFYDLALDLGDSCEPLLFPYVCLLIT